MDHGKSTKWGKDNAAEFKTRTGILMFIIYGVVYAGFIGINALVPGLMDIPVLFGVNLAVVYGFGLIIFAIVMGIIYNAVCTKKEKELNKGNE